MVYTYCHFMIKIVVSNINIRIASPNLLFFMTQLFLQHNLNVLISSNKPSFSVNIRQVSEVNIRDLDKIRTYLVNPRLAKAGKKTLMLFRLVPRIDRGFTRGKVPLCGTKLEALLSDYIQNSNNARHQHVNSFLAFYLYFNVECP